MKIRPLMKRGNQAFVLLLLMLCCCAPIYAQNKAVMNVLVHDRQGNPLSNSSVLLSNADLQINTTRSTDEHGLVVFEGLQPHGKYCVKVSFTGYTGKRQCDIIVKPANRTNLVIKLDQEEIQNIDAVVVTALGIKREDKSLGYSTQTVDNAALTETKTNNWTSALSGKVAGLTIQGVGAGPMGSNRITLRGESSLNLNNNQALVVIDGVPLSSKITGTGFNSYLSQDSPVDFGSNISNVNADDIDNVTVLKGPAATALYGSRAAAGALIITTKSAKRKERGIGVSVNSNTSLEEVNRWPDYQFEYGEGRQDKYYSYGNTVDGANTSTTVGAGRGFGPKFNGQEYFQYDPSAPDGIATVRTPWVAQKDYISGFFQRGLTSSNNISVEGGNEINGARASFTYLKNTWILPNTGFERMNVLFNANQQLSKRLKVSGRFNYSNNKSDNLPSAGYNNQTLMYFLILGTAPNIKPEWFKPYWVPGKEGVEQYRPFNSGPDNPYVILYEMLNKMKKHNLVGNISATYEFSPTVNLMLRSGLDFSSEERSQQRPFSMTKFPKGMYREQGLNNYESNSDFLLSYVPKLESDFKYNISLGGNYMSQYYNLKSMNADQLAQPGIYQLSNSLDPVVPQSDRQEKAIASLYAFGQLSYKEMIFLDVTGRNDWSSTLPSGERSFFYPSVNSSFILSQLFKMPEAISFAKARLSWAQVGNDTSPYQTARYYNQIYGNNLTNQRVLFNPNLKPEITTSYEAGLDLRFLDGRVGADMSIYMNNSRNQILATPVDPVSGYNSALINAGLINSKGIELVLNGQPILNDQFKWKSAVNWALNRSYVKELAPGINTQIIYNNAGAVTIEARPGARMGDMYGRGFLRNEIGQIIYNEAGLPELDTEVKKWGNAFADWKMGFSNDFTYKSIGLHILLDMQKGGSIYSLTNYKTNELGKVKTSLPGREGGIVGDGVVPQADGTYKPNDKSVSALVYYPTYYSMSNVETNIFDASFLKIREVRLSYTFPVNLLKQLKLSNASVSLWGRDLFNFTSFPAFDPEGGNLNNGTVTPGVELAQFPSARSMGVNLSIGF
ncbi:MULTISPECIES: SusC/RagA family TonB-linked outer membrane protein [unclassified Sphingobacterium]|uniref:SusC/RagA family TonB-linked outer membrane protein n=1 Tax=unclassified Sphingobacterium TaxID=2609468 RepID=UPI00265D3FCD|nr:MULTISPECIES: SusC/RagA family TonB-linked outer membrane protein [unclassified Sphingobacterium]WKK58438.1 SusC/RagA family TonB-linked outer membrane protein [Sphingobacterium sp. BN32]